VLLETFVYFAYGSNMLTERLIERCPGATFLGRASAPNYRLTFSKKSKDGSGKATLTREPNPGVSAHGVMFRIPIGERSALDAAEGPGYDRYEGFAVSRTDDDAEVSVTTYLANLRDLEPALRPYDWYRELVLAGAKQHGLPLSYQKTLNSFEADPDPMPTRKARQQALSLLNRIWKSTLTEVDRKILVVAQHLYSALPVLGACYRSTFFLAYHLKCHHHIEGTAEVGFVNDGTDDLFSSHAWYVSDGRITDLAISRPLEPTVQRPGPLTILGQELQPGWKWTYYAERAHAGRAVIEQLLADPDPQIREAISGAERLHKQMIATSKSYDDIRTYLDAAPDGLTYEVLAKRVEPSGKA
jgi:AIG2 family protein